MKDRTINWAIALVSTAIPLVVLFLFYVKPPQVSVGFNVKMLPALNSSLNFTTALLLSAGYYFIRKKQIRSHRLCMLSAFILSALFLISYVIYHSMAEETRFGGEGWIRPVYYFILITHIVLAAAIVPLVLVTLMRALRERFDRHKKIARWTLPLWLYVAVSGVVVYLMLRPYN
jgi:putative membrane protein